MSSKRNYSVFSPPSATNHSSYHQLAPSAFLASAAGSSDLVNQILPPHLQDTPYPERDAVLASWSQGHDQPPPPIPAAHCQKEWDTPKVRVTADLLLNGASDAVSRARLLATATKELGAWLNALPVSSLGLRMDNDTIHVAADGNCPDGITVVPWKRGKVLVWDATCPDKYVPSYISHATREAGAVAQRAEHLKISKYVHLNSSHHFILVPVETSGVFGPEALSFIQDLSGHLRQVTGEPTSLEYLIQ